VDLTFKRGTGLVIENGDIKMAPSDNQSTDLSLITQAGNLRWDTTFGVGIQSELNGPKDIQEIKGRIRRQLKSDGYAATVISFSPEGELIIQGERQSNKPLTKVKGATG